MTVKIKTIGQCYIHIQIVAGLHIFSLIRLAKKQIAKIEKEAKKILDERVEDITNDINKMILERIINSKNKNT